MDQRLKAIYEDPTDPGSYGGLERLYQSAKSKGINVNRKQVAAFLKTHRPYTLHKPARKHYSRNPTIVSGIDVQWQADLVDMQSLSRANNGNKYILTVIDCFSRYAWAEPIKSKMGEEIVQAFKHIFEKGRKPHKLQTDKGKEFLNKNVQKYLHDNGVAHFTTENETKAAMVERFNRTLKTRMWTYFSTRATDKYIDVLEQLVDGYNKAQHRSIGMRPIDVKPKHEKHLFAKLYAKTLSRSRDPVKVGPYVRISKARTVFDKGYRPSWTSELFKVKERVRGTRKPLVTLEDLKKEPVKGRFYPEEVQTVDYDPDAPWPIEKVVRSRTRNGIKESLVKWLDYPSSFNSWVPAADIQDV